MDLEAAKPGVQILHSMQVSHPDNHCATSMRPPPNHPWILAVEDSEPEFYLLQTFLEEDTNSLPVCRAQDGEQAIHMINELSEGNQASLPALVLIDLNLPRIDGHTVLAHLRSMRVFDKTPVLIVTSSPAADDRSRALNGGADAYFVKPMDLESYSRLRDAIAEAKHARLNTPLNR